jgi:hypothetical protein
MDGFADNYFTTEINDETGIMLKEVNITDALFAIADAINNLAQVQAQLGSEISQGCYNGLIEGGRKYEQ